MTLQSHIDLFCRYLHKFDIESSCLHIGSSFSFFDSSHIESVYDLVASANGDFYLQYKRGSQDFLITSSACSGIYFDCTNGITTYKDEKSAYLSVLNNSTNKISLNAHELHSSLISHQLCWSSPLASFLDSIYHCPANTCIILSSYSNTFSVSPLSLLISENLSSYIQARKLEAFLEDTVAIHYSNSDNYILFSGGLDSSLICSVFISMSIDFYSFYKRYNETLLNSNETINRSVQSVADFLSIKPTIVDQNSNINYSALMDLMRLSPRIFVKSKYLSFLPDSICDYISNKQTNSDNVLLSGQNVDTLASLDTFAPETSVQYPLRLIFNIKASLQRFRLLLQIKWLDLSSQLGPTSKPANLASISEHSLKTSSSIDNVSKTFTTTFYKKRPNLFDITTKFDDSLLEKFKNKTSSYRLKILRFYRTIQNSQRNFSDFYITYGVRKDMLFMNGLLFQKMISSPISNNIFFPKSIMYKAFYNITNRSFRSTIAPIQSKKIIPSFINICRSYLGLEKNIEISNSSVVIDMLIKVDQKYPFALSPFLNSKYLSHDDATISLLIHKLNEVINQEKDNYKLSSFVRQYGADVTCRLINLHVYFSSLFISSATK